MEQVYGNLGGQRNKHLVLLLAFQQQREHLGVNNARYPTVASENDDLMKTDEMCFFHEH